MSIVVISKSADFVVEFNEDAKEVRDLALKLYPDDDITIIDTESGEVYIDTANDWDYWSYNKLECR